MVREEIAVATGAPRWKCVESRMDSKHLYYSRFILSSLMKGLADMIGIAMRRALLGEIEGTCITRVKSEKVPHEFSTIVGIEESVHEIVMNLKEIVLRGNLYGTLDASICVRGPRYVTAQDIILPPSVEIVDATQHIANLTERVDLCIKLQINRDHGYSMKTPNNDEDGSYSIDAVFMPVRNANHSVHSYGNGNEKQEILFLEIWTNGSLTPKEALYEVSCNLIDLFIPFLHAEEREIHLEDSANGVPLALFIFHDEFAIANIRKNKKKMALKCIFIDQSELPSKTYNCLKKSNIHTLLDLLNNSQEDLLKIEHFCMEDVKGILDILQKHFGFDLPKNKVSIYSNDFISSKDK